MLAAQLFSTPSLLPPFLSPEGGGERGSNSEDQCENLLFFPPHFTAPDVSQSVHLGVENLGHNSKESLPNLTK